MPDCRPQWIAPGQEQDVTDLWDCNPDTIPKFLMYPRVFRHTPGFRQNVKIQQLKNKEPHIRRKK